MKKGLIKQSSPRNSTIKLRQSIIDASGLASNASIVDGVVVN